VIFVVGWGALDTWVKKKCLTACEKTIRMASARVVLIGGQNIIAGIMLGTLNFYNTAKLEVEC